MSVVTLAVDAMGGAHGLAVTVPAVATMLSRQEHLHIILVGQPEPLADLPRYEKIKLKTRHLGQILVRTL